MLDAGQNHDTGEAVSHILQVSEELNSFKDVAGILDRILFEARQLTKADAGTIYLIEDDRLKFGCVHNDSLFDDDAHNKEAYKDFTLPIDETSIVGCCAVRREPISIDDAYNLPEPLPYCFNKDFDEKTGYRTTSILTLPIKSFESRLVGVLQLINAKDENGRAVSFDESSAELLPLLTGNAAAAIERSIMTKSLILRMMKMAELRDPMETGGHVQRVGAYSAEIYHKWAAAKSISKKEIKKNKDLIRVAAMLHDVGKVGISDRILKKPARLTSDEFDIMKFHTVYGAQLFSSSDTELDAMCRDIILRHHEKWDGTGYPGLVPDLFAEEPVSGEPLQGEEIPPAARIAAVADVYDALTSKRSYKEAWPEEKVVEHIASQAGKHFDPDVVEAFLDVREIMAAIRHKYREDDEKADTPKQGLSLLEKCRL